MTNCMNCGAPLHYSETSYGRTAKCLYCDTEYHIDELGRVEEYKVKIQIQDKIVHFYIDSVTVEPMEVVSTRDWMGRMCTTMLPHEPSIRLELRSYKTE